MRNKQASISRLKINHIQNRNACKNQVPTIRCQSFHGKLHLLFMRTDLDTLVTISDITEDDDE